MTTRQTIQHAGEIRLAVEAVQLCGLKDPSGVSATGHNNTALSRRDENDGIKPCSIYVSAMRGSGDPVHRPCYRKDWSRGDTLVPGISEARHAILSLRGPRVQRGGTKQSRARSAPIAGLLRFARNDTWG
jgi:hypothetical protein